ncbi:MAG: methyltransferase domain-containing protein [Verrucomicrobiota bacterium]
MSQGAENRQINEWEQRYQTKDMPWEKGAPAPGLVDFLAAHPDLPSATVAVPGCGTGHDVLAWARAGFKVCGYDLAPSAVQLCRERVGDAGLHATCRVADFLRDDPPQTFDWLFEHTLFCAISPACRDDYVRAAERWARPGGQFLAIHYLIPDTDGPPFGTTRQEILDRFSSGFELIEDWVPRSYPNRTGLEWMLWWRRRGSPSGADHPDRDS